MKYFCYLMILPFLLAPMGTAMADGPTGNTQADIQKLFKIIEAQQKKIEALEKKVEQYEKMIPETAREVAKEEIKPLMTARPAPRAGLHKTEKAGLYTEAAVSALQLGGLDNITFAVRENPADSEGAAGRMYNVDNPWGPGWRLGIGRRYRDGNEIAFRYFGTYVSENESATGDDNLYLTLAHGENDSESEDLDVVEADLDAQLHRFGIEFTHPFYESNRLRVAWSAGFDYMFLREELEVEAREGGSLEMFVDADAKNHLVGPRAGTRVEYAFNDRWAVTGNLGVALYYNIADFDYVEGPSGIDAPIDVNYDRSKVTPALDTTIGVAWRPSEEWKFDLGFEFLWLYNVFTLKHGIDDVHDGGYVNQDEDFTLQGLTLKASYTF